MYLYAYILYLSAEHDNRLNWQMLVVSSTSKLDPIGMDTTRCSHAQWGLNLSHEHHWL
jgi:hypothetical protein